MSTARQIRDPGPSLIEDERARTRRAQTEAADPSVSAWVSANAGTGKTHVLTTRVLRLLVAGTKPERILCLTYTKAAAAEMSQRVFDRLARWVIADDVTLARELAELQGRVAAPAEITRARDLFTVAIETPGGLKIQTIHAFAERLLQRFPLEAGIPPKFAILDDETGKELRREAIESVLTAATRDGESALGQALAIVIKWAVDDSFDELLADALTKRDWLEAAQQLDTGAEDELAGAGALYRRALNLAPEATLEAVEPALAKLVTDIELRRIYHVLQSGSKQDTNLAAHVGTALTAATPVERIEALGRVFLTGEGEQRKNLMTAKLKAEHPDVDAELARLQDRFARLAGERQALVALGATMALMRLACAVHKRYSVSKARRAALDFDDLIRHTAQLLSTSAQAQWVLYKLDGGLDHILVDEAQDTSPLQWKIVRALAEEFFAGNGAQDGVARTLFAVGDEKQSIYGFQGAAPKEFADMGAAFERMANDAAQPWRRVPLTLSFRSAGPVLEAVDRVFADTALTATISTSSVAVRHTANRVGAAGHVELWDTELPEDVQEAEIWSPLGETAAASSPVARLADRIASTIKTWLDRREMLASEGRPIRAGDILVLVRKRRPFAEAMVSALKARRIPVAGADRIRLANQIAMQDLIALADMLLLPEDDLALANVLKSPLFDLGDDDLMGIAPGRPRALWSALLRAAESNPRFVEAATLLKRWRSRADLLPPFEFFVEILDRDGMRARLLTRLGSEAADPIDEFLRLALSFDESEPPSLQGFVAALRGTDREIKRDMEHGRDEVRVMTVHGAKGLEAPIVFLPDTCTTATGARPGGLVTLSGAARPTGVPEPFLWPVKGSRTLDTVGAARLDARCREAAERNRLLYVALTRPRDRLYIAGFEGAKGREKGCWYDLIEAGLAGLLSEAKDADGRRIQRTGSTQTAPHETPRHAALAVIQPQALPEWALRPAPREPGLVIPLAPSRLAPLEMDFEGDPIERSRDEARANSLEDPPPLSPAAQADGNRFLRGTLTHALLEHLPALDPATWETAAQHFVAVRGADLEARTRASIVTETIGVLRDRRFAPIFGPDSRAEVPLVAEIPAPGGKGHTLRVTGQIDRLVVLDHEVLIVDYKTNRPPPRLVDAVPQAYLLQLAAYRLAVSRIFGGRPVRAALLWTDGPQLMPIPDGMLDAAQHRLFTLDRGSLDRGSLDGT